MLLNKTFDEEQHKRILSFKNINKQLHLSRQTLNAEEVKQILEKYEGLDNECIENE